MEFAEFRLDFSQITGVTMYLNRNLQMTDNLFKKMSKTSYILKFSENLAIYAFFWGKIENFGILTFDKLHVCETQLLRFNGKSLEKGEISQTNFRIIFFGLDEIQILELFSLDLMKMGK